MKKCPVKTAMAYIGQKWTIDIVRDLMFKNRRFSEILAENPGLSNKVLSQRLKLLETANIVEKKIVSKTVLTFLTLGILLDITATTFMILGSSKGGFTTHGIIGYSSLLTMFIDAVLLWRLKSKSGINAGVPKKLHMYSRYAYVWWVLAFITGGLLVALR